jgi:hypothetical protein
MNSANTERSQTLLLIGEMLDDLGITTIKRSAGLLVCRPWYPYTVHLWVGVWRYPWEIYAHNGTQISGSKTIAIAKDVFDLQDWLINEYEKYAAK